MKLILALSLLLSSLALGQQPAREQLTPPGTLIAFAGATCPTGWLLANGAAVSRTTYAKLFTAVSTLWGYGDNSTTFNLPDLRGRFLRGRDGGVARDPDRTARVACNTGGATGDAVGSCQTNATAKNGLTASSATVGGSDGAHGHTMTAGAWGVATTSIGTQWMLWNTDGGINTGSSTTLISQGGHGHAAPTITVGDGDNETRPVNVNVNYCIKS